MCQFSFVGQENLLLLRHSSSSSFDSLKAYTEQVQGVARDNRDTRLEN